MEKESDPSLLICPFMSRGVVTGFEEISCQEERCMAWQKEEKAYPTGNPYKDIILIPAHCKLINK